MTTDEIRTYDWAGKTFPISRPEWSDVEVASKVRMLTRNQLDHEAVCTLARDRIMALHKEKTDLARRVLALTEVLAETEAALRRQSDLVDELCESVDCAAEDIGGQRPALAIIQDLGPHLSEARTALARIEAVEEG